MCRRFFSKSLAAHQTPSGYVQLVLRVPLVLRVYTDTGRKTTILGEPPPKMTHKNSQTHSQTHSGARCGMPRPGSCRPSPSRSARCRTPCASSPPRRRNISGAKPSQLGGVWVPTWVMEPPVFGGGFLLASLCSRPEHIWLWVKIRYPKWNPGK